MHRRRVENGATWHSIESSPAICTSDIHVNPIYPHGHRPYVHVHMHALRCTSLSARTHTAQSLSRTSVAAQNFSGLVASIPLSQRQGHCQS